MKVTKEMFDEWRSHPVTIEVFKEVQAAKDRLKDRLGDGATVEYQAEATHGLTNKVVGQIQGLNQLLNISYEDDTDLRDETSGIIEN